MPTVALCLSCDRTFTFDPAKFRTRATFDALVPLPRATLTHLPTCPHCDNQVEVPAAATEAALAQE